MDVIKVSKKVKMKITKKLQPKKIYLPINYVTNKNKFIRIN